MNLATFFEKFDQMADAPDAVARIRDLVLQLAMRGQLVEQVPAEGDVSTLLSALATARAKSGRKKVSEDSGSDEEVEGWHQVPKSWKWVPLKSLGDIVGGGTPRSDNHAYFADNGVPWLTPADLNGFRGKRISRGRRSITEVGLEESSARILPEGSVLLSSRAPIGYVAIAGTALATNQGFKSCIPFVPETNEFLYYYLMCAAPRIDREASGTTFREVSGKAVSQIPVPLPPLAEQKRIVAKVDELMSLCDRLEALQREREQRHAVLARAALSRFADAPTPENLTFLFHRSYNIDPADLRKSILTLAVQGRLVTQDSREEPATELLANIKQERLAAQNARGRSAKPQPPVEDDEMRNVIRPGWAPARLSDLVIEIQTGPFGSSLHQSDYQVGGTPVINPASLRDGKIVPIGAMAIGKKTLRRLSGFQLREGDIVMARRGEMGRCAVVTKTEDGWLCGTGSAVLRMPTGLHSPFLALLIGAPQARRYLGGASVGTTMQNLNQGILAKMPVSVPPLPEQRRIVTKVNELMVLVDKLEARLDASIAIADKLLDAIVSDLTSPAGSAI